jgi:hypothetical protein
MTVLHRHSSCATFHLCMLCLSAACGFLSARCGQTARPTAHRHDNPSMRHQCASCAYCVFVCGVLFAGCGQAARPAADRPVLCFEFNSRHMCLLCFLRVASCLQDVVRQPDQLLTDMTVLLCGINVPAAGASTAAAKTQPPANNPPPQQQQQQQRAQTTRAPPFDVQTVVRQPARPQAVVKPQVTVQPVVRQPPQPATSVQMGVYKGTISCEGFPMQVSCQMHHNIM